jgi:hypothetical protein
MARARYTPVTGWMTIVVAVNIQSAATTSLATVATTRASRDQLENSR